MYGGSVCAAASWVRALAQALQETRHRRLLAAPEPTDLTSHPLPANSRHQLAPRSLQHPPSIQSGWPLTVALYHTQLAQAMQVQARTCTACPLRRTRRTPGTTATHGRLAGRRAAHRASIAGREAGVPWDLLGLNRAVQEKLKAAGALGGTLWQGSHLPACGPQDERCVHSHELQHTRCLGPPRGSCASTATRSCT